MANDISELKNSNYNNLSKDELIELAKYLKKKNMLQENFMLNIAHDLKNPINVIVSILQCMDKKQQTNKNIEYMELIRRNSLKMIKLIDNLINTTKLEGNYYNFNKKNVDVINIIESTISSIAKYAKQKNIDLIFDTNVDECIMSIEPQCLDRIVMNLISNGIKFSPNNSKIFINAIVKGDILELSFKDNGIGIAKEEQKRIFDRFVQVSKQKESENCGSGIGLDLVSSITVALGGKITLKSKEGQGSEFILNLPIKVEENEEICREFVKRDNVQMLEIEFSDIYL